MRHRIFVRRAVSGLGVLGAYLIVRRAVCAALKCEGISFPCEISVLLTGDEGIRKINDAFRGINDPTDVLSFPCFDLLPGEAGGLCLDPDPNTGRVFLGDIALSIPRAESQGESIGHGTNREIAYLTVHSVLHLLGYDHIDEKMDKPVMRAREKDIMNVLEPDLQCLEVKWNDP